MSDPVITAFAPVFPSSVRFLLRILALGAGLLIGWDFAAQLISTTPVLSWSLIGPPVVAVVATIVILAILMRVFGSFLPVSDPWTGALLEAQTTPSLIATAAGQVLSANKAYHELCARLGHVKPVTFSRLFSAEQAAAQPLYRLAQALAEGQNAYETVRIEGAGRQQNPRLWHLRVTALPDHPVYGSAALWCFDEEEIARPESEPVYDSLREAAEALDQAPVGYFACNQEGKITQINATLASWLNWDLALFFPGEKSLYDLFASDTILFENRLSGFGEKDAPNFTPHPVRLRRSDGQELAVRAVFATERSGHSDLRVMVIADWFGGQEQSLQKPATPKQNADLVAAQGQADAAFFAHIPMAVAVLDAQGRVLKVNPRFEAVFGGIANKNGVEFQTLLSAERRAAFQDSLAGMQRGAEGAVSFEAALVEGERSVALDLVSAPTESAAMVEGGHVLLFARETTEHRNLQAQFEQAQKMQAVGELAGGIAHDFNNVLQGILGFTDLLLVSHRPTDPSFQDLMQIKQNATRAAGLVRQLLAFSRRQTLRPRLVGLNDAVTDVSHLVRRLLGEAVPLEIKLGRDLWSVMTDPGQFEQAVLNLAVNARDAMPQGGRLSIRTRNINPEDCAAIGDGSLPAGRYVAFEIEDTGTGIASSDLPKIFQPFFTTKDVGKGTGLGLSMVYGFVKQSGGYVFCRSMVGVGTCFTLVLPCYDVTEQPEEAERVALSQQDSNATSSVADMTGAGTILLVEDEDAVRAFAARALTQRGYSVIEAASGVEALEQVAAHPDIDLIVSDVVMPEMDGPTMLRHLREQGASKPIIFVSGYAEEAFSRNLPEGEDFGFLPKPFTLKQLVEAVKQALTGQKKAR